VVPENGRWSDGLLDENQINYAMSQKIEIEGRWWISGLGEPAHYGSLSYEPSIGLTLSVKIPQEGGACEALEILAGKGFNIPKTIFGADKDNHPISLYGCTVVNFNSSGGLRSYTIVAMVCLSGRAVENWEGVAFDHLNAEFSLFHNWIGISNIKSKLGPEFNVSLADRNNIEIRIGGDVAIVVWPKFNYNQTASGVSLSEGHQVQFRFPNKLQAKESMLQYAESFRRFLTLLVNRPVYLDAVYFHPDDGEEPRKVTVLKSNPGAEEADRKLLHPQMLVSYHDIHDQFEAVVSRWFELEDSLGDVLNLYFATIFVPGLYLDQTFLFLAQALEVYHRTSPNFVNQVQSKADFKARKKRVIDQVPDEKEWLTEKLAHANEKTLAQRLSELIKSHKDLVARFIDDEKAFCDAIRHTRNHYTHYGTSEEGMGKVSSGVEFIKLVDKMRALLELCILSDLGIVGVPIDRLIQLLEERKYCQL
jgi:hypothetical protein